MPSRHEDPAVHLSMPTLHVIPGAAEMFGILDFGFWILDKFRNLLKMKMYFPCKLFLYLRYFIFVDFFRLLWFLDFGL